MSSHTPGPWTLKHVSGSNFAVQRFEIRGMFGSKLGVSPIFNRDTSAIDGASICCSPQDASLIAAAPDLLEALQDSIMALEIVYPNGSPVLNAARAAIARARGES